MSGFWISANSLPREGRNYTVDDPALWAESLADFGLPLGAPLSFATPLTANVFLLPSDSGFLVRGRLRAEVVLPCSRCAEDSATRIDQDFESFESFPGALLDEGEDAESDVDAALDAEQDVSVVRDTPSGPEIDLAALIWQELLLSLPVKPLCAPDCKGLCPKCGENLNLRACACAPDEGDPRLAALRALRVQR